jgi:hypothetical protein
VDIPNWMEGDSLISTKNGIDSLRPIFSVYAGELGPTSKWRKLAASDPPFYSLGGVNVIVAQRFYTLHLENSETAIRDIEGHTAPIKEEDLPSVADITRLIINHLEDRGYDVSSLKPGK